MTTNFLELQQGSEEWKRWRRTVVTSSDAASILEIGFKTPYQLWQQKLGLIPEDEPNAKMLNGIRLEPIARANLQDILGVELEPTVIQNGFMGASIDGLSPCGEFLVEIKCGEAAYMSAEHGWVADYYIAQCQHHMACHEDADRVYFYAYNERKDSGIVIDIFRDEAYIKKLIEAEKRFWDWVQNLEMPPLLDKDYQQKTSPEWEMTSIMYKSVKEKMKALELEEAQLRQELISMAEGKNSKGNGLKLTKIVRKGTIAYDQIPALIGLDLEVYRKKAIESYRITYE